MLIKQAEDILFDINAFWFILQRILQITNIENNIDRNIYIEWGYILNFKTPCLCSRGPTLILPPSDQLIPILQLAADLLTNGCPLK